MDEYTSQPRVWVLTCPGFPEEVGRARRFTHDVLSDSPCAEDAVLIVSELGTNAVKHTASGRENGAFYLSLVRVDHWVTISVTDGGGTDTAPHIEHPDEFTLGGRGLDLVTVLADSVTVSGHHGSRTVTAELRFPTAELHVPATRAPTRQAQTPQPIRRARSAHS